MWQTIPATFRFYRQGNWVPQSHVICPWWVIKSQRIQGYLSLYSARAHSLNPLWEPDSTLNVGRLWSGLCQLHYLDPPDLLTICVPAICTSLFPDMLCYLCLYSIPSLHISSEAPKECELSKGKNDISCLCPGHSVQSLAHSRCPVADCVLSPKGPSYCKSKSCCVISFPSRDVWWVSVSELVLPYAVLLRHWLSDAWATFSLHFPFEVLWIKPWAS